LHHKNATASQPVNDAAVPEEDTYNDNDMPNMISQNLENVHTVQLVIDTHNARDKDIAIVRKLQSDQVEEVEIVGQIQLLNFNCAF